GELPQRDRLKELGCLVAQPVALELTEVEAVAQEHLACGELGAVVGHGAVALGRTRTLLDTVGDLIELHSSGVGLLDVDRVDRGRDGPCDLRLGHPGFLCEEDAVEEAERIDREDPSGDVGEVEGPILLQAELLGKALAHLRAILDGVEDVGGREAVGFGATRREEVTIFVLDPHVGEAVEGRMRPRVVAVGDPSHDLESVGHGLGRLDQDAADPFVVDPRLVGGRPEVREASRLEPRCRVGSELDGEGTAGGGGGHAVSSRSWWWVSSGRWSRCWSKDWGSIARTTRPRSVDRTGTSAASSGRGSESTQRPAGVSTPYWRSRRLASRTAVAVSPRATAATSTDVWLKRTSREVATPLVSPMSIRTRSRWKNGAMAQNAGPSVAGLSSLVRGSVRWWVGALQ